VITEGANDIRIAFARGKHLLVVDEFDFEESRIPIRSIEIVCNAEEMVTVYVNAYINLAEMSRKARDFFVKNAWMSAGSEPIMHTFQFSCGSFEFSGDRDD